MSIITPRFAKLLFVPLLLLATGGCPAPNEALYSPA